MQTAQNSSLSKNALWDKYRDADSLVRDEIMLELKKAGLFRHWWGVASKASYDLHKAKAPLRDIFVKLLPESAPLFGLPPVKKVTKQPVKPKADGTLNLFEQP
ncbi:hypothetical protein [Spirosoma fluminis]